MADLYPTKTRLTLLRDVGARLVVDGSVSLDERHHGHAWLVVAMPGEAPRKVTAAIGEMERAGWVELHEPSAQYRLTEEGRAVLERAR